MQCYKCNHPLNPSEPAHYGLHPACFKIWFQSETLPVFTGLQRKATASSSDGLIIDPDNSSFFHGKFKKYTAILNGESYILKMREPEAPELPEVEYLCNKIAAILGISTAQFYYLEFTGDRVFVTKNFIAGRHGLDLQHIYHFRTNEPHDCETLMYVIKEYTKQPRDILMFIHMVLFDALIGNHDRHGRNLAFIASSSGYQLSPTYDNVSYLGLEHGKMLHADFNPTGKIATRCSLEPSMTHYVAEFMRLGYGQICQDFYKKITFSDNAIKTAILTNPCTALMKAAMQRLIFKRNRELYDALSTHA
ncbi:MAG: hypothetical protein A3E82_08370 [Gammaproteobacteria bacterium RIFCSPHIGHO2_12_FULL_38_11]|nr:MAG: hypothetical protein A3E82_08370 [Gammaproteobacteria bacterium RIFCSPHIGHO2_12_FULL_38_11]